MPYDAIRRALSFHMPSTPEDEISPNSGVYWQPRLESVAGVPVPRTEFCRLWLADDEDDVGYNDIGVRWDTETVAKAADSVGGYPAFVRTAFTSGKHEFESNCRIEDRDDIDPTIAGLVHEPVQKMLPAGCLMVREWLSLDTRYTGFRDGTPIAPEVRAFIEDGEVVCLHPYWPEEAIRQADTDDWREVHDEIEAVIDEEQPEVRELAAKVAERFADEPCVSAWSVDFARVESGNWYAIDMAHAGTSHHPTPCAYEERWPDPRPE